MKTKVFIVILFISFSLFSENIESIQWVKTVIEVNDTISGEVAIGNPNIGFTPSNKKYLYCANIDRNIVEYSYENNQWNKNIVQLDLRFHRLKIAPGRNDNNDRIYCYNNNKLYEVWCFMGIWFSNLILEITDSQFTNIVIEDGRNDGVNRVYISNNDHKIYELTFEGPGHNDWDIEIIDQDMYCEDIGSGRNDNINRIYGVGGDDEWTIYELTYNSVSEIWEREEVYIYIWSTNETYPSNCWSVCLGKTRSDDELYRIYYIDVAGEINELFWNANSWGNTLINVFSASVEDGYSFGLLSFGEIDSPDSPIRILFAHGINSFYSFIYNSGIWERTVLYESSSSIDLLYLTFGNVRNTGNPALYVSSLGKSIMEFYPDSE